MPYYHTDKEHADMEDTKQENTKQMESITQEAETPYDIIADCSNDILIKVLMSESPHME